jgi:SAM-dependent MidA family methyltransferase
MSADDHSPGVAGQLERDGSNPALVAAIRAEIAAAGCITFARYMDLALYHPEHGYYRSAEERPGRGGDFLTAPELSPFFGQCLARQVRQVWEELGRPGSFTVLEYGAGSGRLAHDILATARAESPDFAACLRYRLHELNPHRRANARALLASAGLAGQSDFEGPEGRGADVAPFAGMVLTNEFVDALPVHRVVGQVGGAILERYVRWDEASDWFIEELDAPSTPRLAAALAAGGVVLEAGQSAEINLAAGEWLAAAAGRLARGLVLTIDYGYPTAELYAPKRREGTFSCYYRHTANDDPYARVGEQDMTAHVDFGALLRAGEPLGLRPLGLTTQGPFLSNLGLGELLVAAQTPGRALDAYLADRSAVLALIEPGGMGRFGVLAQGKDFAPATPLRGFGPLA